MAPIEQRRTLRSKQATIKDLPGPSLEKRGIEIIFCPFSGRLSYVLAGFFP
jgi:hypothetical protein